MALVIFIVFLVIFRWWRNSWELYHTNWKVKHSDLVFQEGTFGKVAKLDDQVVTVKTIGMKSVVEDRAFLKEMSMLKSACHKNVTTFVGACTGPNNVSVIWEHCSRGSLEDILMSSVSQMDSVRQLSVALDISNGLLYLHTSEIGCHGNLKASSVVVDDHWVAKITDFGLTTLSWKERKKDDCKTNDNDADDDKMVAKLTQRLGCWRNFLTNFKQKREKRIKKREKKKKKDEEKTKIEVGIKDEDYGNLYWTSPDRLRSRLAGEKDLVTKESDVYSLGVLFQQIVCTAASPYEGRLKTLTPKDIVTKVAYPDVGSALMRPHIPEEAGCQSVAMAKCVQLIRSCWSEDVDKRPAVKRIVKKLKRLTVTKEKDLWAVVSSVKKRYSAKLAPLVGKTRRQRNRIPSALGNAEPLVREVRDVTVCFWSVVNFTHFVIQRSPADALQMLQDIDDLVENVIENFNVCKVNTVCNSSFLMSGSSAHTADHASIMADASLVLLDSIFSLNAQHRPYYHDILDIRLGLNSGPVVVGVVGKATPRLCVFGKTVGSALQCERHSFPRRIHISSPTYNSLQAAGTFSLELRNPLDAKSVDTEPTYWLYGKVQEIQESQL